MFADRQRGQALVLGIVIAAVGAASLVVLYNLGQTIEARSRLTHAADAAAYSGALVQARALNAIAYVNRSQIAHQVALAHLVTLGASAQYLDALQSQRRRGNPPAGLIAMLFGPDAGAAYQTAQAPSNAEGRLARAFAQHDRVVHQVLETAAREIVGDLTASRDRTMREVLAANFPATGSITPGTAPAASPLALRLLTDGWPGYTERHAATRKAGLRPATEGAVARYGFLDRRNATRRNPWAVSSRCPWLRHELRRRGSTWLGPDGQWGALDTQSYHALRSNRWIGCYFREYAMGWGTVQGEKSRAPDDVEFIENPPADFSQEDFWRWVEHATSWNIFDGAANPMANSYAMASARRWPGGGLPAYLEVAPKRLAEPLRFAVAISLESAVVATTDADSTVAAPTGQFGYAALGRTGAVTVSTAAETYFARPERRADGRLELATLFRPYWQARLSAVTPQEAVQAGRLP
ncbi:hypothetical protein CLM73_09190 [Achromobacter spanius]|uniref:Putative Flp pilus-assembly TadG-like N-terminal domain-containing protein n=1 Tax=Achromobacter spanius TaxID=217203 RepID=A0A2S0I5F2_9BURK|nr:hypothetical protein CLM73_09190 [Achromobacter spanius]